ncbi:hypothetical protein ACNUIU_33525 [Pseudomonas aeruginosa]|uniref:hypothetical protein n=1 Tax=Pseudomonas aeruginosa TaxID=287 RepID=UPI003AB006E5
MIALFAMPVQQPVSAFARDVLADAPAEESRLDLPMDPLPGRFRTRVQQGRE